MNLDQFLLLMESEDYRGSHQPPHPDDDVGAPIHDLSGVFPDDIYSSKGAQYYGHHGGNHPLDRKAIAVIQSARGNPNKKIRVYRAVPESVDEMQSGNWVTTVREYAKQHGESVLGGKYKIIDRLVPAKQLWTHGDSIMEFGAWF
jgi:hypothetical protein